MSYRDDLGAAMARITQLEAELEQAREGQAPHLDPLRQRIRRLERGLQEATSSWRRELDEAEAGVRQILEQAAPDTPTLAEHNRSFQPLSGGDPAGVICPYCLHLGQRVEMVLNGPIRMTRAEDQGDYQAQSALCPRCSFIGIFRLR